MYKINPCVADIKLNQQNICNLCKKKVYDFTTMSNEEVMTLAEKNNGSICGKSSSSYFNSNYYLHPLRRFAMALLIVFGSSIFILSAKAQDTIAKIQKEILLNQSGIQSTTHIKGTILEHETMEPIVFANVWIEIEGQIIGVVSDFDGHFSLSIPSSLYKIDAHLIVNLNISLVGYEKLIIENINVEKGKIITLEKVTLKPYEDIIIGMYIPYNENTKILDPDYHRKTTIKREEIERFPGRP